MKISKNKLILLRKIIKLKIINLLIYNLILIKIENLEKMKNKFQIEHMLNLKIKAYKKMQYQVIKLLQEWIMNTLIL